MSNEVTISLPSGKTVIGHAPVIVSASRSTDIPAFYADWFMNRLRSGYCVWYNPFNQKPMYISFAKTKVVVFWTKNPEPMLKYLPELDRLGLHYYFQVTLNDMWMRDLNRTLVRLAIGSKSSSGFLTLSGKRRSFGGLIPLS